jgi:hypothetical protein
MQREVIGSARATHAGMSSAKATMRSRHSSAIVRKLGAAKARQGHPSPGLTLFPATVRLS